MPLSMRAHGRCAFCGTPAYTELLLLCADELRAALAVCKTCAGAVTLGDWQLLIRGAGRAYVVDGRDSTPQGDAW